MKLINGDMAIQDLTPKSTNIGERIVCLTVDISQLYNKAIVFQGKEALTKAKNGETDGF